MPIIALGCLFETRERGRQFFVKLEVETHAGRLRNMGERIDVNRMVAPTVIILPVSFRICATPVASVPSQNSKKKRNINWHDACSMTSQCNFKPQEKRQ